MKISIQNEYLSLVADSFGAEMVSLKNTAGEEMIWQAEPEVWGRHAPVLFPWTGRLTGGAFTHKGQRYEGGQHGFARDLEHEVETVTESSVSFILKAGEETAARFPYDFTLRSVYVLEGKTVIHRLEVINNGEEELYFGIGYHPAFALPFDAAHDTEDYEIRFDRPESPVIIDTMPHGLVNGKNYYQWKNTESITLTDDLFYNDSFCMAGLRTKTVSVYEKDSGRHITCDVADFPYTLLWSAPTEKMRFVCIEPWHSLPGAESDSGEWTERAAATVLKAGETWSTELRMSFER